MKNKTLAGVFALVFGYLGVHRFYLGQTGLGIAYLLFCWFPVVWLIALIDAIVLLSMDQREFDHKYNWKFLDDYYRDKEYEDARYDRPSRRNRRNDIEERARDVESWERQKSRNKNRYDEERKRTTRKTTSPKLVRRKPNPFRESGVRKFKEYDFDGAIDDFEKALEIDDQDVAVHFNIACAYSISECKDEAFYHLDRAVKHGFKEFDRIENHDALAYLRIQPEFQQFKDKQYRLSANSGNFEKKSDENQNLLEQLQKLAELREKGLLTEEEFNSQKRRLLG